MAENETFPSLKDVPFAVQLRVIRRHIVAVRDHLYSAERELHPVAKQQFLDAAQTAIDEATQAIQAVVDSLDGADPPPQLAHFQNALTALQME